MRKRTKTSIFIRKGRLFFLTSILVAVFCAIFVRLAYLHIERSEKSINESNRARNLVENIPAKRGNIVDSKNNLLATSRPVITLGVDPERVEFVDAVKLEKQGVSNADIESQKLDKLHQLAGLLNMRVDELTKLCSPHSDPALIAQVKANLTDGEKRRLRTIGINLNMTYEELIRKCVTKPKHNLTEEHRIKQVQKRPEAFKELAKILKIERSEIEKNFVSFSPRWKKIAEKLDDETYEKIKELKIKGITGTRSYIREYPSGKLAAHIVGFVNKEFIAQQGIESKFDYYLKGQDGLIETEIDGRRKELAHWRKREIPATDGNNIELTIDSIIQEIAQREVRNIVTKYNPTSATIIISDPSTGYILGMESYPNYDPNTYNKFNPDCLRNRAICDQYEPGSTFKIVSISAALNESLVNPDDVFDCDIHTVKYKNRVLKLPKEAHKMGKLSVRDITKKSSNKGSAQLGIMLGEKKLYEYASLYGFGKMTNISLSGEISGTLHEVKNWDGLTITRLPMGHAVAATPLQVHCAMSVIANQGIYMQPQVVRRVFNNKGETEMNYPPKAMRRVISSKIATIMSDMLVEVVGKDGTARRAALTGFKVAGKTGTTQKIINGAYSSRDHVASFSGFFPAQRPRLVITVVVDSPKMRGIGYGGVVAAPAFKNVAEQAANYLGIQTDDEYEKKVAWR